MAFLCGGPFIVSTKFDDYMEMSPVVYEGQAERSFGNYNVLPSPRPVIPKKTTNLYNGVGGDKNKTIRRVVSETKSGRHDGLTVWTTAQIHNHDEGSPAASSSPRNRVAVTEAVQTEAAVTFDAAAVDVVSPGPTVSASSHTGVNVGRVVVNTASSVPGWSGGRSSQVSVPSLFPPTMIPITAASRFDHLSVADSPGKFTTQSPSRPQLPYRPISVCLDDLYHKLTRLVVDVQNQNTLIEEIRRACVYKQVAERPKDTDTFPIKFVPNKQTRDGMLLQRAVGRSSLSIDSVTNDRHVRFPFEPTEIDKTDTVSPCVHPRKSWKRRLFSCVSVGRHEF